MKYRIFIFDKNVFNVDNEEEASRFLANGAVELSPEEIATYGMAGHEHLVSPLNTLLNEDGSITFTPPSGPTLKESIVEAREKIDMATSMAITAGFNAQATPLDTNTPEHLHFSYDTFDQQNFADSAIAMQLGAAAGGESGIPAATPWNAYRNWTPESGGELVVLQLTAETFLPLYAAALNHKAACMAEGSARKAAVAKAESVEAVQALLEEWEI